MTKEPKHHSPKVKKGNSTGAIKGAAIGFRDMLNDGGLKPSTFLLGRMRDYPDYRAEGEIKVPMPERVAIADKLVQYELPRLAAIEAEVSTTMKTHEDWVRELNEDVDEPEEKMLKGLTAACPDCLGTGRGSAADPEVKCETCRGSGRTDVQNREATTGGANG